MLIRTPTAARSGSVSHAAPVEEGEPTTLAEAPLSVRDITDDYIAKPIDGGKFPVAGLSPHGHVERPFPDRL